MSKELLKKLPTEVLQTREATHGSYADTADIAQQLKFVLEHSPNWARMNAIQKESIQLICTKLARIGSGNHKEPDHWKDIAGYATLVEIALTTPTEDGESK